MKKILSFLIITMLITTTASAEEKISVYLNNNKLTFEQPPIIINDSTLVPFRTIFESLDMTVQWFGDEQRVTAQNDDTLITLFIDDINMNVNGDNVELNTPPIIYNDFTLVPLRAVSEASGADVLWDGDTRCVYITSRESSFNQWRKQVLELTNIEREKNNLSPLNWDNSLAELAEIHCKDMIDRDFFSHNNPDGETPFDRMKKYGIEYFSAGENIAAGQFSPQSVVESWMNSQGHRANILNPDFKSLGVAVVKGGTYGIYWAQEFAALQ